MPKATDKPTAAAATDKGARLYEMLGGFSKKSFTLKREIGDRTVVAKLDTLPTDMTPETVATFAAEYGIKGSIKGESGAADGTGAGRAAGTRAAEFVRELTAG